MNVCPCSRWLLFLSLPHISIMVLAITLVQIFTEKKETPCSVDVYMYSIKHILNFKVYNKINQCALQKKESGRSLYRQYITIFWQTRTWSTSVL